MYKVDAYLTLRKHDDGQVTCTKVSSTRPATAVYEGEALLYFKLEVDNNVFDPSIDTGVTLKIQRRGDDFDVTKVVSGLKAIRDEIQEQDRPF